MTSQKMVNGELIDLTPAEIVKHNTIVYPTAEAVDSNADIALKALRNKIYAGGDAGQMASYERKANIAAEYIAAGYPETFDSGKYRYLVEGTANGLQTMTQLADTIAAQADIFDAVDAKIEAVRTGMINVINAADEDQRETVVADAIAELQTEISTILAAA